MRTLVDDKAEVVRSGTQSIQLHVKRETWSLTLRDEPGGHDVPCEIRLRRALKVLLRRFGIRAVSIGPAPSANGANGPDTQSKGTTP